MTLPLVGPLLDNKICIPLLIISNYMYNVVMSQYLFKSWHFFNISKIVGYIPQ